jgi:hypothetical protein
MLAEDHPSTEVVVLRDQVLSPIFYQYSAKYKSQERDDSVTPTPDFGQDNKSTHFSNVK